MTDAEMQMAEGVDGCYCYSEGNSGHDCAICAKSIKLGE